MKEALPVREKSHSLTLNGRERCEVTGVTDVDLFNEQVISAVTDTGSVKISGNGLHVESLNLEKGLLIVTGRVDALNYDDAHTAGRKSLMGRIFR